MPLERAAVGGRARSRVVNGIIDTLEDLPADIGLKPVIPTSAAGTGVALGAAGEITVTAGTVITIDGAFGAEFDSYLITLIGKATTAAAWSAVLRASAADDTTTNYDVASSVFRNAGSTIDATAGATSWALVPAGTRHRMHLILDGPALTDETSGKLDGWFFTNPIASNTNNGQIQRTLLHRTSTAFTGIKLTLSTGTFTGKVRIYGYSKLT